MFDEVAIYSRLDSSLYGALGQACEVVGRAIGADAAAARVIGAPSHALATFVGACRFDLSAREQAAIEQWPTDRQSIFEVVRGRPLARGVFRIREELDELEYARTRMFEPIEQHARVADSVCMTFGVEDNAWAIFVFVRTEPNGLFDDRELDDIEKLRPAVTRLVKRGFEQETGAEQSRPGELQRPRSIQELLAKLSRTERQILHYLRSPKTEREIADTIGRSRHTVHVHVKSIYRKLSVTSRKELLGLVESS